MAEVIFIFAIVLAVLILAFLFLLQFANRDIERQVIVRRHDWQLCPYTKMRYTCTKCGANLPSNEDPNKSGIPCR